MVEVKNLVKKYGEFEAVKNVSFTAKEGRILGFLGPNGAGKTTTMRIITTYMPPTDGTVIVGGYDIWDSPKEVRKIIGYLPEIPPLYNELRVVEYLKYVAKLKGLPNSQVPDIAERLDEVIQLTGLNDVAYKLISQLSKGYKQRVGIAQAIIHNPQVVILDEPTIGLDPNQVIEVRKLIKSLSGEHTVILSTHILPEVTMTCDDVVIINKGEIVAADSLENLTLGGENIPVRIKVDKVDGLDDLVEKFDKVRDINVINDNEMIFEVEDDTVLADISKSIIENGYNLYDFHRETVSLEKIFSELTVRS